MESLVFGSVPSRRLGRSLGVNNIPHKVCTYSCLYCQVGKTKKNPAERKIYYSPDSILQQVKKKLACLDSCNPDYISIVPNGEPTLDINLGELIVKLRTFGIPIAVITNGSLINHKDVRQDIMLADYVSIKVDTVSPATWKIINKPPNELIFSSILSGIEHFSKEYKSRLVTESMMIKGINESHDELISIALFLQKIRPFISYIAIPTRPPASINTIAADELAVTLAYDIFTNYNLSAELLTAYEGNAFASSGNFEEDILSITAVHPMRKAAVMQLLERSYATDERLKLLIDKGLIEKINYNNQEYYLRKFSKLKKNDINGNK